MYVYFIESITVTVFSYLLYPSIFFFFSESFESKLQISARPRLGNFPELLILLFLRPQLCLFPNQNSFLKAPCHSVVVKLWTLALPSTKELHKQCLCGGAPMHAPWPGWAAKVVVSPDAARWPSDTTWKLGRVQTGGSDSNSEAWEWEGKSNW